jgi:hypothetical protein
MAASYDETDWLDVPRVSVEDDMPEIDPPSVVAILTSQGYSTSEAIAQVHAMRRGFR